MPEARENREWELASTTWEIRKAVWLRWSLGDTAERTLDYLASIPRPPKRKDSKRKGSGIPEDRATVYKIRRELSNIPPHIAGLLIHDIPSIISFVEDKRPDLKGKLSQDQRSKPVEQPNWIEEYEAKYGKLPSLPEPLGRLVKNHTLGQPVSKDMVILTANIRQWNAIKSVPALEKKWREFLEWLGQDPDAYEYKVRSQPIQPIRTLTF